MVEWSPLTQEIPSSIPNIGKFYSLLKKKKIKKKRHGKALFFKKRSSNDTNLFDKNVLILSQEFLNPHVDAIPVVVSPHVELGGHDELQDDADQKLGGRARVTRVQKGLNFFSENV